ncbi:MAG: cytochrome c oxidase assembly protein [Actinobacteria bacterium]|nr:cytochrome c oxidase assembly protein [Actinomycetota bacterium]
MSGPWALEVEPGPVALIAAIAGAYGLAAARRSLLAPSPERALSRRQVWCFSAGVLSLLLALVWPMHRLGEDYLFSAHMLQHMVIGYVTAPLLLLGTPGWMLRALLGRGVIFSVTRALCRPLVAFLMFNLLIVVTHWPALVDLSLRQGAVHAGLHLALIGVSLVVWMPVVSPLPEIPRLAPPMNLLYLFGQSIVPTVPASFLTFGDGLVYDLYGRAPRLWNISAITDQQVAGLLMKVGGGFLLWGTIAVLFFVWQADEEREERANRRARVALSELELGLEVSTRT